MQNLTPYTSLTEALKANPNLTDILVKSVISQTVSTNLNIGLMRYWLDNKTIRPKIYKGSTDFNEEMIFKLNIANMNQLNNLIPRRMAYPSLEKFKQDFTDVLVSDIYTAYNDSMTIIQPQDNPDLPDIKYNVYIGCYAPNSFTEQGNDISTLMVSTDVERFVPEEFNVMSLAGSTPQTFKSDIPATKTKLGKIGQTTMATDEYSLHDLAINLFTRESNLSKKHGNLASIDSSTFAPPNSYAQIASGVSKNDTVVMLNHKFDTPPKDMRINAITFNTILYIPVGISIDTYLAEERIKRDIIRAKLKEIILTQTGGN